VSHRKSQRWGRNDVALGWPDYRGVRTGLTGIYFPSPGIHALSTLSRPRPSCITAVVAAAEGADWYTYLNYNVSFQVITMMVKITDTSGPAARVMAAAL
jgi:hypothetical protein